MIEVNASVRAPTDRGRARRKYVPIVADPSSIPSLLASSTDSGATPHGRQLREQFPAQRAAAVPLQIPFLAPALKVEADRLPYAFAYVHDRLPPQLPAAIAVELRFWTRRTFLEFRKLQLRLLLEELRASLAR